MTARVWHAAVALAVVAAVVLQTWLTVDAASTPSGHAVGTVAGTGLPGRLLRLVSFFTIESNVLSGVVSTLLARRPDRDGVAFRAVRLAALFGITVTGVVYSTVLAKIHTPLGWRETVGNDLVHYVVPIAMVLGWLLFGPRPRITVRVALTALSWPVLYFGWVLVLGAASGWYPYPFVDVTSHGYLRVLINAVLVTLVFAVVGALYAAGDRLLPAAPRVDVRRVSRSR